MIGALLKPELIKMIDERDSAGLREALCEFPVAEIAEIFEDFDVDRKVFMMRTLPDELAADLLEHLDQDDRELLADALQTEEFAGILDEMEPDDRTDLLEEIEESDREELLDAMRPEEREMSERLLEYPEDSIGREMSPEFVSIEEDWTGDYVIEHLRAIGKEREEALNELYVTDSDGKVVGSLELSDAVIAPRDKPVSDSVDHHIASAALKVTDDKETAVAIFRKYDRMVLPVVDENEKMVGIVTHDDIFDVAEEEATEDMQKMSAMEALDEEYLSASLFSMFHKRVGWLAILFVGQLLTAFAMSHYEGELEDAMYLVFFLPLIISCGGNCGSQAATLVIRSLAVNELNLSDWWKVVRQEIGSGLSLGAAMAALALAVTAIHVWTGLGGNNFLGPNPWLMGVAIAVSLIGVVIFGCLFGGLLPLGVKTIDFDPAVCSTPLVMTFVDVLGLLIYLLIARAILGF